MKKRLLALGVVCLFALSSCAALLERSYSSVTSHASDPSTAEDSSALRVESYRELVDAVLYLVSQGAEEGTIRLYDYDGEAVAADLANACAEVATQDPFGAYAVDYIRHEYVKVVSYYEASLSIGYRRTAEQIRSIVNVTGTGAIRTQLRRALSEFDSEVVLQVTYFSQDEESIAELLRETYEEDLTTALGFPETAIHLYPDAGRERIVEILLTWPESAEALRSKSWALTRTANAFSAACAGLGRAEIAQKAALELAGRGVYDPDGGGTAYAALTEGRADGLGMARGYLLLCRAVGLEPKTVDGIRRDEEGVETDRLLVAVDTREGETLYLDPTEGGGRVYTQEEFFDLGYRWPGGPTDPEPEDTMAEDGESGEEILDGEPLQSENP